MATGRQASWALKCCLVHCMPTRDAVIKVLSGPLGKLDTMGPYLGCRDWNAYAKPFKPVRMADIVSICNYATWRIRVIQRKMFNKQRGGVRVALDSRC